MTADNIELLADKIKEDISKEQSENLKQELKTVSDEKISEIENIKIKRSLITVLLSAFLGLFGAGSFYLGYFKRGIVKICFNVILPLACGLIFIFWLAPAYFDYHVQGNNAASALSPINKTLNPCLSKYSEAYENLSDQLNNVEKENEELKAYLAYVTEDEFDINSTELLNCVNTAFDEDIFADLNSLIRLNELINAEDYNSLIKKLDELAALISKSDNTETVKDITDLKQRLSDLIDNKAIEKSVAAVNALNAFSFYSTGEKLKTITAVVDEFLLRVKENRKIEDLTAAVLAVSENSLMKNCTAEMLGIEKNLEVITENFESLRKDLKAKYLAFTGKEYTDEKDSKQKATSKLTFEGLLNSLKTSLKDVDDSELANELTLALDSLLSKLSADTEVQLKSSIAAVGNYQKAASEEIKFTDNENSVVVSEFVKDLDSHTVKACEALVAINYENVEESDKTPNGCLQKINSSINVMTEQKQVFLSVSGDMECASKNIGLVKFVENKLDYHNILTEVLIVIDDVRYETDVDILMDTLDDKINVLGGLGNKASSYAYDWKVDSEIVKYLFITLLSIDGVIILAYWIGEVFKDRTKCHNINYDNIIKKLDD